MDFSELKEIVKEMYKHLFAWFFTIIIILVITPIIFGYRPSGYSFYLGIFDIIFIPLILYAEYRKARNVVREQRDRRRILTIEQVPYQITGNVNDMINEMEKKYS